MRDKGRSTCPLRFGRWPARRTRFRLLRALGLLVDVLGDIEGERALRHSIFQEIIRRADRSM
jgi:hypothetical protein